MTSLPRECAPAQTPTVTRELELTRLELVLVKLSPRSRPRIRTTILAAPLRPWMTKQSEDFLPDAVTCREDLLVAGWFPTRLFSTSRLPGQHPYLAIGVVLLQVVVV